MRIAMVLIGCVYASAQPVDERASRAIDAALQALGGIEQIRAIQSIAIFTNGTEDGSPGVQGAAPGKPESEPFEEKLAVFPSSSRLAYEIRTGRTDHLLRWRRWILHDDQRMVVDFLAVITRAGRGTSVPVLRARLARRVPHLLMLEVAAARSTARWVGESSFNGSRQSVIEITLPGETPKLRLFLDARTQLLTKFEYSMDFPGRGDTEVEQVYRGWAKHPALGCFPAGHQILIGGEVYQQADYAKVSVNASDAEALFQMPDHLKPFFAPPGAVQEIAKGVYIADVDGFYAMFIEFDNFVLAVEAPAAYPSIEYAPVDGHPGSSALSELYLQKIKQTIPNKPVRYLAVTHYHSDHTGGARAFFAEGATLLTTPGTREHFEKLASAKHTLIPDRLAGQPRRVAIETVEGTRRITDGKRTVELLSVGANPHADESLVVYLPEEKFLFQGDLFYFDGEAEFPPRNRVSIMGFFARWLEGKGLAPERIYGAHGRGFATMRHVREILRAKPDTP